MRLFDTDRLLDAGGQLIASPGQDLLGHKSSRMTTHYSAPEIGGDREPRGRGQPSGPVFPFEAVVARHFPALRQLASLCGHALDVASEFDFLDQQHFARSSIFLALARKTNLALPCKLGCWCERFADYLPMRSRDRTLNSPKRQRW